MGSSGGVPGFVEPAAWRLRLIVCSHASIVTIHPWTSVLVLGITEVVALEVREGRVHRLESLQEQLLAPAIDLLSDCGTGS
jgi:hypothetical protein